MDLRLVWNGGMADLALADADLSTDDGLRTAIILSLFTDRRAEPDDVLPSGTDRKGWWADAYRLRANGQPESQGSRLWLLSREKTIPAALTKAQDSASEALAWLVEDGVADQVLVAAERQGEMLAVGVTVQRPRNPPAQYQFNAFWKGA
jgi:phage gp46-like protein